MMFVGPQWGPGAENFEEGGGGSSKNSDGFHDRPWQYLVHWCAIVPPCWSDGHKPSPVLAPMLKRLPAFTLSRSLGLNNMLFQALYLSHSTGYYMFGIFVQCCLVNKNKPLITSYESTPHCQWTPRHSQARPGHKTDHLRDYGFATGWTVQRSNPGGGDIFRTRLNRSWCPPNLLHNGYRVSFLGVKRPGRGANHPPLSSAEVKEIVDLYLYSPLWAFTCSSRANFTLLLPRLTSAYCVGDQFSKRGTLPLLYVHKRKYLLFLQTKKPLSRQRTE